MRNVLIGTMLLLASLAAGSSAFGEQAGSQGKQVEVSSKPADNQPACRETTGRAVTGSAVSAKRLIGMRVANPIGEEIGHVNDLAVNRCGRITHLVVQVGGFMGFGGRLVRVPLEKVRIRSLDHSNAMVALVRETRKHMLNRDH
jgi:sporulation protein YlmC with PRC-barrel domain